MDRRLNDHVVARWAAVVDAVHHAGGPVVPISTVDLSVIRYAYQAQRKEWKAAVDLLNQWADAGTLPPAEVLRMRHALGLIDKEQLDYELGQLGDAP